MNDLSSAPVKPFRALENLQKSLKIVSQKEYKPYLDKYIKLWPLDVTKVVAGYFTYSILNNISQCTDSPVVSSIVIL